MIVKRSPRGSSELTAEAEGELEFPECLFPTSFPALITSESYFFGPRESTLGSLYGAGFVCVCFFKFFNKYMDPQRKTSRKKHCGSKSIVEAALMVGSLAACT